MKKIIKITYEPRKNRTLDKLMRDIDTYIREHSGQVPPVDELLEYLDDECELEELTERQRLYVGALLTACMRVKCGQSHSITGVQYVNIEHDEDEEDV